MVKKERSNLKKAKNRLIKAGGPWTDDSYESDDPMKSLDRDDAKKKLWKKFQADRAIFNEG
jgi:hypothetical protein